MVNQKSTGTAYLLLAVSIFGLAGLHRFYLGKIGTGILYSLTFGLFGIGLIYDLFTLPTQVKLANYNGIGHVQQNNNVQQNVVVNVIQPEKTEKNEEKVEEEEK
ncbi:NINE protein [Falsibacillus pallidus]|uniref:NINE protein n=1 Tax=Falsibacillus pallidus TaxID=493781 RepID=UPI003D9603C3